MESKTPGNRLETRTRFKLIADDVLDNLTQFDNLVKQMNQPEGPSLYHNESETNLKTMVEIVVNNAKHANKKLESLRSELHNKQKELEQLESKLHQLTKKQAKVRKELQQEKSDLDQWNTKLKELQPLKDEIKLYKMLTRVHFVHSAPNIKGYIERPGGTSEPFEFKATESAENITKYMWNLMDTVSKDWNS